MCFSLEIHGLWMIMDSFHPPLGPQNSCDSLGFPLAHGAPEASRPPAGWTGPERSLGCAEARRTPGRPPSRASAESGARRGPSSRASLRPALGAKRALRSARGAQQAVMYSGTAAAVKRNGMVC